MNDEWNRRYVADKLRRIETELYQLRAQCGESLKQRERNALANLQFKIKELSDKIEETK